MVMFRLMRQEHPQTDEPWFVLRTEMRLDYKMLDKVVAGPFAFEDEARDALRKCREDEAR